MIKLHLIVGARPNFMKIAPLYDEFSKHPNQFKPLVIHTGQHYDERMSKFFFDDLGLPKPHAYLGVGSCSHAVQTAKIMQSYEEVLLADKPDHVIVAGDVNSTVACALNAVKMHIPVSHLEAGLRSFDRKMPEEINRIITDSISNYLLIPSIDAEENLLNEGVDKEKIFFAGNIMIDSLVKHMPKAEESTIKQQLGINEEYVLVTLHRPSNVDDKFNLEMILKALNKIAKTCQVVFPMHPRTQKQIKVFGFEELVGSNVKIVQPVGYHDFLNLQINSKLIVTDSGGIQEESTYFGIPCLTLRPNTERPITITEGTNKLIKLEKEVIITEALNALSNAEKNKKQLKHWDGNTAKRIVEFFKTMYGLK